eukprot:TRINITY_DN1513_c2_g1_i3.p1 TRINITY_DN1513_c2_g1~~TRINITY_DN1513_c2_g1_i3.p1  ORF type:complete len:310 (+),score=38.73 TRINITY_DN1513_c2_g1_i3:153-1082(+)
MVNIEPEEIFGGKERMTYVRTVLQELKDEGASLMIISHGFTEVVEAAMKKGDMPTFDNIFGANHPDLSSVDCDKTRLTAQLIKKLQLHPTECILVDDDPRNLLPAKQHQVCPTLFIWSRNGASEDELRSLSSVNICSSKKRNYSLCKTVPIPSFATSVAGGYYAFSGAISLESAVSKANAVPPSCRFEPVKIVCTPEEGAHLIYCSVEHLTPFREMLDKYCSRKVDLGIPDVPPRPVIFKRSSASIEELLEADANRFVEIRSTGSTCIDAAIAQLTSPSFLSKWKIRRLATTLRNRQPVLCCVCCRLEA